MTIEVTKDEQGRFTLTKRLRKDDSGNWYQSSMGYQCRDLCACMDVVVMQAVAMAEMEIGMDRVEMPLGVLIRQKCDQIVRLVMGI
jgi:hypothetical protein